MFSAINFAARLSAREDRWSLLKDFIAKWHGPLEDGVGYSAAEIDMAERRLGLNLPAALRELYGFAGSFVETFSVNPYAFTALSDLNIEKDDHKMLWLFAETQAIVSWGIQQVDLAQEDPPVYSENSYASAELLLSNQTFSEFVLQAVVHQTACFTVIGGNACGKEDTVDIVKASFLPLGLPAWHWPSYPAKLYGGDDVLIELDQDDKNYCWVWVAARTKDALHNAVKLLDLEWDYLYEGVPVDEIK